jgi:hypothetical protein
MGDSASTLELALLLGAVLTAVALTAQAAGARTGIAARLAKLPPLPVALVPIGYLTLLAAEPSVRLAAMAAVALAWAAFRVRRLAATSARPASGANERPRLSSTVRLAAMAWLAVAPGLMVAADRAPAIWLWSDALGALLALGGLAAAAAPEKTSRAAAYFRLNVATSRSQKRWGERLLAWALYAMALSTPEGWLTIFAPAVLASRRLLGGNDAEDAGALSATTPMS